MFTPLQPPFSDLESEKGAVMWKWVKRNAGLLIAYTLFCGIVVVSGFLIGKELVKSARYVRDLEKKLTPDDRAHIAWVQEEAREFKGKEILTMEDGTLEYVALATGFAIKTRRSPDNLIQPQERPVFDTNWYPYQVREISRPGDPDYPEKAAKFLQQ